MGIDGRVQHHRRTGAVATQAAPDIGRSVGDGLHRRLQAHGVQMVGKKVADIAFVAGGAVNVYQRGEQGLQALGIDEAAGTFEQGAGLCVEHGRIDGL